MYRCLWNIYQQNTREFEVIVVDNASDDGSVEEIRKFPIDNLVVMPHQRFSAMETINIGFNLATRPYTLILDNDAYFMDHTTVSRILAYMQEHPDVGILAMNICNPDKTSQIHIFDELGNEIHPDTLIDYYEFVGACTCFRTDVLQSCGYYDESFGIYLNELDLSFKVLHAGYRLVYHPDIRVGHTFSVGCRQHMTTRMIMWTRNYWTVVNRYFAQPYRTWFIIQSWAFYAWIHQFRGHDLREFSWIAMRHILNSVVPRRVPYDQEFPRRLCRMMTMRLWGLFK